eukprot:scaffold2923_cov121-Cylindrotheca_fusiformis.AAC.14
MVADMSYKTVSNVIESWEMIRRIPNYEQVVGLQLFQQFFSKEPTAKVVLGFPLEMDPRAPDTMKNPRFIKKAKWFVKVFVQMIDKALDMLGPDTELLTDMLLELGKRHVRYGVKPEYFPSLGKVLIDVLGDTLDASVFTPTVKNDWIEVYGALSYDMIRGQKMLLQQQS